MQLHGLGLSGVRRSALAPPKVTVAEAIETKIAPFRTAHERGWTLGYFNRTGGCVWRALLLLLLLLQGSLRGLNIRTRPQVESESVGDVVARGACVVSPEA